jgi:hypothetical protein
LSFVGKNIEDSKDVIRQYNNYQKGTKGKTMICTPHRKLNIESNINGCG